MFLKSPRACWPKNKWTNQIDRMIYSIEDTLWKVSIFTKGLKPII